MAPCPPPPSPPLRALTSVLRGSVFEVHLYDETRLSNDRDMKRLAQPYCCFQKLFVLIISVLMSTLRAEAAMGCESQNGAYFRMRVKTARGRFDVSHIQTVCLVQ